MPLAVPEAAPAPPAATGPVSLEPGPTPRPVSPVIERGTGVRVGQAPERGRATIAQSAEGEITLNVVDADLREVVRLVLEDTLGANYIIDPLVEGTITVQTSRPLPADALLDLLDGVLRLNGAALVQSGDLFKVVPIDQALSSGLMPDVRPVPDAGTPGFAIQVVPLRFVGATEMTELLAPFAPPGGTIQADPARNLLILAGGGDQLQTMTNLIAMFDVDWLAGMSFGLFPLEIADPERLAAELEQIFAGPEVPAGASVRFLPIERLRAMLVISPQASYVDRAKTWIDRLDRGGEGDEPQVFVYSVQNGRAADLAEVLGQLFGLESSAVGADDLLAPGLEPIGVRSSGFDVGEEPGVEGEAELLERAPSPGSRRGAAAETGAVAAFGEATPSIALDVRVIADATTNSLVIRATPDDYRTIEAALRQLDILPLQVLIEATIAEVRLTEQLRYGLQWFFRFGSNEIRLSALDSGAVQARNPGFSALFTSADDVRVILDALERLTDVNVVSSPQLLVLDNQTALLQVGDEVPIVTRQSESTLTDDARVINTVEQRQTGVILTVTPRVNVSGLVIMEIEQEVSDVEETLTSNIDSPTISQRRVASTVAIQSGETVALGGLIQDELEQGRSGIPFLVRLPFIGPLFGQIDNSARRTELLVLITPRIVRDPAQARAVTNELRRRLSAVAPLDVKLRR